MHSDDTHAHSPDHDPFEDTPLAEFDRADEYGYRGCLYAAGLAVVFWFVAGFLVWLVA